MARQPFSKADLCFWRSESKKVVQSGWKWYKFTMFAREDLSAGAASSQAGLSAAGLSCGRQKRQPLHVYDFLHQ